MRPWIRDKFGFSDANIRRLMFTKLRANVYNKFASRQIQNDSVNDIVTWQRGLSHITFADLGKIKNQCQRTGTKNCDVYMKGKQTRAHGHSERKYFGLDPLTKNLSNGCNILSRSLTIVHVLCILIFSAGEISSIQAVQGIGRVCLMKLHNEWFEPSSSGRNIWFSIRNWTCRSRQRAESNRSVSLVQR